MASKNSKKNKIQRELEKLAWQFSVEAEKLKKEIEEEGEDFLEEAEEGDYSDETRLPAGEAGVSPDNSDNLDEVKRRDDYNKEIESWYTGGDYGANDMGRQTGIVFDEDRLEAARVTDWHKPPKLRESGSERFVKGVLNVSLWPFKAVVFLIVNFFRGLFLILFEGVKLIYKICKGVVVTFWQIILAFKYAWVYLFGDFNWLKKTEAELASVAVKEISVKKWASWSNYKPVLGFVVVALLLVLPLQIYLSYTKAKDVEGQILGASELGLSHFKQAGLAGKDFDFEQAGEEFNLAEKQFVAAEESVRELGLIANSVGNFIPDMEAGKKLLLVAQLSAQIGQHLSQAATMYEGFSESIDIGDVEAAVDEGIQEDKQKIDWQGASDELEAALTKAYEVKAVLAEVSLEATKLAAYQPQLELLQEQMPEIVGWLEDAQGLFEVLAHLMGSDETRRWMLVFQNNSELRPTGGFMGSYAIVDVKDGQIKNIEVPGGGFYDLKGSLAVMVDAPYPFHLFSPIWQPWNANWFADWPESAKKIMWFYGKSGGPTVDGVISFTPNVMEDLLALVGEIEMPEYETSVNSENFVRMAQVEVELDYDKEENQPKKFIGDLLPEVLDRLVKIENDKLLDLWQVVSDSLKEKHLLVYLNDEDLQSKVEDFGWAGQVIDFDGDYLLVVQTNVAGGKTDRVIKTKIEHEVEILKDGAIVNTVRLTKEHQGDAEDIFEGQVNTDYVRFYVPEGSKLLVAEGFDAMPSDREFQIASFDIEEDADLARIETNLRLDKETGMRITDEFDKTVFANWMQVAPGEVKSVMIKYLLPFRFDSPSGQLSMAAEKDYSLWTLIKQYFFKQDKIDEGSNSEQIYSLLAQKQPGISNQEFISTLKLDTNWKVKDYLPKQSLKLEEGNLEFSGDLATDEFYGVVISN